MLISLAWRSGFFAHRIEVLRAQHNGAKGVHYAQHKYSDIQKGTGTISRRSRAQPHVTRQTIPKWERSLSVPDSEMLIALDDALEVSVSTLVGENVSGKNSAAQNKNIDVLSQKLEVINLQISQQLKSRRKALHEVLISLLIILVAIMTSLILILWFYGELFPIDDPIRCPARHTPHCTGSIHENLWSISPPPTSLPE